MDRAVLLLACLFTITRPHSLGYDIVSKIAAPMIIGQISVGFIVLLVQSIENDNDIYYCVTRERITYVFNKNEEYSVNLSISDFYQKLPKEIFFRCHRSYVVNINKIREIIPWCNSTYNLKLQDIDYEVPVSRSNVKEFKQLMHI